MRGGFQAFDHGLGKYLDLVVERFHSDLKLPTGLDMSGGDLLTHRLEEAFPFVVRHQFILPRLPFHDGTVGVPPWARPAHPGVRHKFAGRTAISA